MNAPRIVKLIYSESRIGNGTVDSPNRLESMLHTLDGKLVAKHDPCSELLPDGKNFEPYVFFSPDPLDI